MIYLRKELKIVSLFWGRINHQSWLKRNKLLCVKTKTLQVWTFSRSINKVF